MYITHPTAAGTIVLDCWCRGNSEPETPVPDSRAGRVRAGWREQQKQAVNESGESSDAEPPCFAPRAAAFQVMSMCVSGAPPNPSAARWQSVCVPCYSTDSELNDCRRPSPDLSGADTYHSVMCSLDAFEESFRQ